MPLFRDLSTADLKNGKTDFNFFSVKIQVTNTYKHFHESLQKARDILLKNQYLESVIDRLIKDTLNKIFEKKETVTESEEVDEW